MDTTNNQLIVPYCSSSFSPPPPPQWDVFLSFYGKDTRRNFISNLYFALFQAGIRTFRDDPALEKGQQISSGLLDAIRGSKKFVVVISENYARSAWCLNELVQILSCKRTENQVVPVFYYVDPSDLRYQKGSFGEALQTHQKRHSVDMVDKWRSALAEIAMLSGYHLKKDANQNESDTVQELVKNVTPTKVLDLEKYLVGIDSAVEEIYQKLSTESNDVRGIGICGMGGIGKTTLAKAVYNKYSNNFDLSCFIESVKQISGPLLSLLKQLLTQLLKRKAYEVLDVECGVRQLTQILSSKKALIVLDDLDQRSYSGFLARLCNLFSAGSRIIITTRDANLLSQLKVDISKVDLYMVNKLGEIDSLGLFSYHAFGKPVPPESFRELSVRFVTYAGGLPLALKVLGSSLRGRTQVSFWKAKLEKVLKIPENDIQKILKLSYDELDDEADKAIFLDIVFFYVGKDKDEAVHVFKSCDFYPEVGIPILVERCLLTVEDNKFQMHNLIQDMGRDVIREESKHGKSRRLYLFEENACEALQNLEGADKIEGLILDLTTCTNKYLNAKIFERLSKLRLLWIIGAHDIKGNFKNSFNELRCIRWHYCPWTCLPSHFCPQKLVSLDMPFSKFKKVWKGAMRLVSLKTIDVSYSMNLEATPDFSGTKLVEKLLVRGCKSMLKLHSSVGQLTKLGHLDLCDCVHLKRLPEPIKHLTNNLGSLNMGGCRNLKRLPEELGDMKGLKILDASHTAIEELPDSIAHLKGLFTLNLSGCRKLRKLPEQFGNMEGLREFKAESSAIEQLPDSFEGLTNLVTLNLSSCLNLRNLPNGIWKLKLLEILDLRCCSKLERLPKKLGNMQCLKLLYVADTAIEEVPDSIGLLSRLEDLAFSWCEKLQYLPNSIWNLTSLAKLYLPMQKDMIKNNLPDTISNMKLEHLSLTCNIRLWLPLILTLSSSLEGLFLIDKGQSLSPTKPFSFSKLSNLKRLVLINWASLGSSLPELPPNLGTLELESHASVLELPDLSSLKQLTHLIIRKCSSLQSLPPLPPRLQFLQVSECTSLQDVPDLSMLKELQDLNVIQCSNLKVISLKESCLQLGFKARIPNKEIAEWWSYKSSGNTVSFEIPPVVLGDNFSGVALWVVFKICKTIYPLPQMKAVITNKTEGITKNHHFWVSDVKVGEVGSTVDCISKHTISVKSGDRIKVSFQKLLYRYHFQFVGEEVIVGEEEVVGEVKVEMCGAHVIQKTLATPY